MGTRVRAARLREFADSYRTRFCFGIRGELVEFLNAIQAVGGGQERYFTRTAHGFYSRPSAHPVNAQMFGTGATKYSRLRCRAKRSFIHNLNGETNDHSNPHNAKPEQGQGR